MCTVLAHYGLLDADTVGPSPRDPDLVGTPAAACGPGAAGLVCFVARTSRQWVFDVPVPGGTITQTLAAVCPSVDGTPAALGRPSFIARAPGGAPGALSWQYRLTCGGTNADVDDPALGPGEAAATCATFSPEVVGWTTGPLLDPGQSTSVPFSPYGVSHWVLEVATRNPAAPGLVSPCGAGVHLTVAFGDVIVPFGSPAITFAPVVSNVRALADIEALATSTDTLSTATNAVMLELRLQQALLLSFTGLAPVMTTVLTDIVENGQGQSEEVAAAVAAWSATTLSTIEGADASSSAIIDAFTTRMDAFSELLVQFDVSQANFTAFMAAKEAAYAVLETQVQAQTAVFNETRLQGAVLKNESIYRIERMDNAIAAVGNFADSMFGVLEDVADTVEDIAVGAWDGLTGVFGGLSGAVAYTIKIAILCLGVFLTVVGIWKCTRATTGGSNRSFQSVQTQDPESAQGSRATANKTPPGRLGVSSRDAKYVPV
jgi:hypothetical protein